MPDPTADVTLDEAVDFGGEAMHESQRHPTKTRSSNKDIYDNSTT